jgi:predicted HAD superfamily Cof-like phosphohydrolase
MVNEETRLLNICTFLVQEFHEMFGQPRNLSPEIIPDDRAQLRQSLLEEEVSELREAIEKRDLVAILDAICDVQYILSGTIIEYGLHNIFDGCFNEVHESNLAKMFEYSDEAQETIDHYTAKGIETEVLTIDMPDSTERFVIKRLPDGKILKPKSWKAPDIAQILKEFKDIEHEQTRLEAMS